MSKLKLVVCALALGITSASVHADSSTAVTQGKVTFDGKLIADTCEVATESQDIKVVLPTLSVQSLDEAGKEAGSSSFQIKAINCPASITKVAAHFEVLNTRMDYDTGNLLNTADAAGAATNVEVRLYNEDSTPIRIGGTGNAVDVVPGTGSEGGTATMNYAGGYYAIGATTAGKVHAEVTYTLAYK